jgi:hypothetical protein
MGHAVRSAHSWGEFERAQVLSGAERERPRRRLVVLAGRSFHRDVFPFAEAEDNPRLEPATL